MEKTIAAVSSISYIKFFEMEDRQKSGAAILIIAGLISLTYQCVNYY